MHISLIDIVTSIALNEINEISLISIL